MQQGRTHKRTDPFPSATICIYLWQRPEPSVPGTAPPGLRFSPVTRQTGSQRRTGRVVVNNNLCSGSIFSPVRMALCNRVEHTTTFPAARPRAQGRPYGDRSLRQGRTYKRTDPFPLTTLLFYLWQRPEPKAPGTAPSAASFPDHEETVFPKADRFVVVNNFCSGSIFSLVRMAFCNRIEHTDRQIELSVLARQLERQRPQEHKGRIYARDCTHLVSPDLEDTQALCGGEGWAFDIVAG